MVCCLHDFSFYYSILNNFIFLFRSGFEPPTQGFSVLCSNQLSYLNIHKKNLLNMYLLLVFLPFFGFLLVTLFGRFFGYRGAPLLSTSTVLASAVLSFLRLVRGLEFCGSPCYIQFLPWFQTEMFVASWGFLFDSLTVIMCVVVTFVSSLVHIYSISYMGEDPHLPRFMSYLSVFTFLLLMLVTSDNFIQMFLVGKGRCSFLLAY